MVKWASSNPKVNEYALKVGRNEFTLDELMQCAEDAALTDDDCGETYYIVGKSAWATENSSAAFDLFEKASRIEHAPWPGQVTQKMFGLDYGILLLTTKPDHDGYLRVAEANISKCVPYKNASDDELWLALAGGLVLGEFYHYHRKDFGKAERNYLDALGALNTQGRYWNAFSPDIQQVYVDILTDLTVVNIERSMPQKALANLNSLVKYQPKNPENWFFRGYLNEELGLFTNALSDYMEAITNGLDHLKNNSNDLEYIEMMSEISLSHALLARKLKSYKMSQLTLMLTLDLYKKRANFGDDFAAKRLPAIQSELNSLNSEIRTHNYCIEQSRIQQEEKRRIDEAQKVMREHARNISATSSHSSTDYQRPNSSTDYQRRDSISRPIGPPNALPSYKMNEAIRDRAHGIHRSHGSSDRIISAIESVSRPRSVIRMHHMPHRPHPRLLRH